MGRDELAGARPDAPGHDGPVDRPVMRGRQRRYQRKRRATPGSDALLSVLDAVRMGRSASRQDVERTTGLSRAVVAQRIQELVDGGLIAEPGTAPSTGGRPPRQLRFEAAAGHLLVADLGATSIDVAITDLDGNVSRHEAEGADISAGPDVVLTRVEQLFDDLRASAPHASSRAWGVGIGVPGPVEFRSGSPVAPPIMPGWDGYPIRERFRERYGVPVWVDNDVNLMALGEWRHGAALGHDDVVFVKIGTGIGAGLISDGVLHRGAQGSAGDIGHIQITDDPSVVCRCGNVGCLEALAGGAALARDAARAARDGRSRLLHDALERSGDVTAADVARAASHGDAVSVELLQRSGRLVGQVLATVVNVFNPSLVVIGGGVADAGDLMLAAIRQQIYGRSLPLATRHLAVTRSALGGLAGVRGAATMVVDELFSPERLPLWLADGAPAAREMVETHG